MTPQMTERLAALVQAEEALLEFERSNATGSILRAALDALLETAAYARRAEGQLAGCGGVCLPHWERQLDGVMSGVLERAPACSEIRACQGAKHLLTTLSFLAEWEELVKRAHFARLGFTALFAGRDL